MSALSSLSIIQPITALNAMEEHWTSYTGLQFNRLSDSVQRSFDSRQQRVPLMTAGNSIGNAGKDL